ncbi:hypothetical protein [Haloferax sp. DFSO60]|uniref:hypothetical protein n=1 Tax=Haloferax sp. DFSO60 TaxID=3388652 RepID=UPI00397D773C
MSGAIDAAGEARRIETGHGQFEPGSEVNTERPTFESVQPFQKGQHINTRKHIPLLQKPIEEMPRRALQTILVVSFLLLAGCTSSAPAATTTTSPEPAAAQTATTTATTTTQTTTQYPDPYGMQYVSVDEISPSNCSNDETTCATFENLTSDQQAVFRRAHNQSTVEFHPDETNPFDWNNASRPDFVNYEGEWYFVRVAIR